MNSCAASLGRTRVNAENAEKNPVDRLRELLQWGRAFVNAEGIGDLDGVRYVQTTLQWGRVCVNAEGRHYYA